MHINNWVHASDLMKMVKSANSISTLSSEEGLPDNHVITIRERELTVDFPELIQNNIKTDTVTLDLDAEWDGIQPVIIFGPNADGTIAVEYTGEPVHIPGAVMQYVGGLDCSVMGLDDSGEVRLVTKAAPNTFEVVESGEYIGQISEDDVSLLGQILSAIKDAETATSDASSAAEDATAAANSANTAATKATNAANSANTAATKATAAANSANTASERAENAYDVLTPIIAEIGVNGNQPRATTNPNYIATASDAYAAKPLEICIKGKTWVNRWPKLNAKGNGITVSTDETGLITVTGELTTPTTGSYISMGVNGISVNKSITALCSRGLPDGVYLYVNFRDSDNAPLPGELQVGFSSTTETQKSATVPADTANIIAGIAVKPGTILSGSLSFRVMLVDGTEAPDCFTPPASITSAQPEKLVTAGKNLLPKITGSLSVTNQGITFTKNADGYVHVEGTATGEYPQAFVLHNLQFPPGLDVKASHETTGTMPNAYAILYGVHKNGNNEVISGSNNIGNRKTDAKYLSYFLIVVAQGSGASYNGDIKWQLELGSTATAYEPPAVTTTPIDLDGNTLCSLPDGTHDELTIDATGAVTLTKRTQRIQLDGDANWTRIDETPYVHYISLWSNFNGLPSGYTSENHYVDKLPASNSVQNGLYSANINGISAYLREPTFASDAAGVKTWMGTNTPIVIMPLLEPQTISLPPVTLPTLPSPNITVYHDSDVPSDITVEYVQDINIVLDNLNAKIAALNIAQSISS